MGSLDSDLLTELVALFKTMSEAPDDAAQESIGKRSKRFDHDHGLPVLHPLAASSLFELAGWFVAACVT